MKSFSDYVQNMINGLRREWVRVDMLTFGANRDGVCFGCAATNALCELMGRPFSINTIDNLDDRAIEFNEGITQHDLSRFESSVNDLRAGYLNYCLLKLRDIQHTLWFTVPQFEEINPPFVLPTLSSSNWDEKLEDYEKYVAWLKEKGL